ncbi:MAG: DUF1778 domain-containing protein [Roseomonas sp.]|nr:DUF1778 domain-containing protein [Roseomonas sp.]MCA3356022.1 DUF1778 domain-containing protein [Roseomonas sp.]
MSASSSPKDDVIQIRASAETKALFNRAAAMRGQKLSEFMLQSARQNALERIFDQRSSRPGSDNLHIWYKCIFCLRAA